MRSFLEEDPVCEVIPTGMLDDELGFRPTKYADLAVATTVGAAALAAATGGVADPALDHAVGREWAVIDPDDPDAPPTVDIKGFTDDQADDMTAWKKEAVTNEHDQSVLDGLDTSISTNWNNEVFSSEAFVEGEDDQGCGGDGGDGSGVEGDVLEGLGSA